MSRKTPRFVLERLNPRSTRPHLALQIIFWTTVLGFVLVRGLNAWAESSLVPELWPHHDGIFITMTILTIPLCALWPLTYWERGAPPGRRTATVGYLLLSLLLFPAMDFGGYILVALAVAAATCAFGPCRGLLQVLAFGAVNALAGLLHPDMPNHYALVNGGIMTGYGLALLGATLLLLRLLDQARRTRELLAELEEAHTRLREHAARDRERAINDERARMAREMHDSTGHHLSAVHLILANAERAVAALPEGLPRDLVNDLVEDIGRARRLTKETLADTRRWVRALKPIALADRSGPTALRSLTESFGDLGVATTFTTTGEWPTDLDGEAELVAYRGVQEALTNALRHSAATRIEVSVHSCADHLDVVVADDGRGPGTGAPSFGLTALRERLSGLGGTLETGARAGGGFELRARIPVMSNERAEDLEAASC